MSNKLYAAIVERDGREVLFYLEPDGDDFVFHAITPVAGLGQADLKSTLTPKEGVTDQQIWDLYSKDNFAKTFDKIAALSQEFEVKIVEVSKRNEVTEL